MAVDGVGFGCFGSGGCFTRCVAGGLSFGECSHEGGIHLVWGASDDFGDTVINCSTTNVVGTMAEDWIDELEVFNCCHCT